MDVWQSCMLVPGLNRSECASWVQAWGSIGAIVGAIWISRLEQRRRRKETDAVAAIAGVQVLRALTIVRPALKNALDCFREMRDREGAPDRFQDALKTFSAIPELSAELARELSMAPHSAGFHWIEVIELLAAAKLQLESTVNGGPQSEEADPREKAARLVNLFEKACDSADDCERALKSVLNTLEFRGSVVVPWRW
jgi:hypothetical protein